MCKKGTLFDIVKVSPKLECKKGNYFDYTFEDVEWLLCHKSYFMTVSSSELLGSYSGERKFVIQKLKEQIKSSNDHIIDLYKSLAGGRKK